MNKTILTILMGMLIMAIGIGAVSAMDCNDTDEVIGFEQNETIQTDINDVEVLSLENSEDEIISADDNNTEVLSGQNSEDEILTSSNSSEVLNVKNNENQTIAANVNSSQVLSSRNSPPSDVPVGDPTFTHSSNLNLYPGEEVYAKVKVTKKNYNRFILNTPSKTNEKLWKKYKKFAKTFIKKFKKSKKKRVKAINRKYDMIDWYYGIRTIFVFKGKYCTINWICMGFNYE